MLYIYIKFFKYKFAKKKSTSMYYVFEIHIFECILVIKLYLNDNIYTKKYPEYFEVLSLAHNNLSRLNVKFAHL